MERAVIYARVSSSDQFCAHQVMAQEQARQIDMGIVTELSRWGRSTQDLLETLSQLAGSSVSVVTRSGMTFKLDSPYGRLIATMLASVGQFERYLIANGSNPASLPPKRGAQARALEHFTWHAKARYTAKDYAWLLGLRSSKPTLPYAQVPRADSLALRHV